MEDSSGRKFANLKFRRQHPIGPFIVNFYCNESKLVIEVDGNVHAVDFVEKQDKKRQYYLEALGLTVLRFDNELVFSNPAIILESIHKHFKK